MKRYKNVTVVFDGADIASAFGFPNPGSKCAECGHKRYEHRREIYAIHPEPHREESFECDHWDRRRKTGTCPCEHFAESEAVS
jgi:hypothetical protein